jgi:hypothetical protein
LTVHEFEDAAASRLRGGLEMDLGVLEPGPAPFDAVIARGRAIRRGRRRTWGGATAVVVVVALGASLALPSALHGNAARPSSPTDAVASGDWISVNSAAYDEAHGYAGSGTYRGASWHVTTSKYTQAQKPDTGVVTTDTLVFGGDSYKQQMGSPQVPVPVLAEPLSVLEWVGTDIGDAKASTVYAGVSIVPAGTGSVLAHYTNGKTATFPVVKSQGKEYVVLLAPASPNVDRLTAYRTDGTELGFVEPYSGKYSSPETDGSTPWYKPGQKPPFSAATVVFSGMVVDAPGTPWTVKAEVGGFGACFSTSGDEKFGGMMCDPKDPAGEVDSALGYSSLGSGSPLVLVIGALGPNVARVVATLKGGQEVNLPLKRIQGWGYCADVFAAGKTVSVLTSYDAAGNVLQHVNTPY